MRIYEERMQSQAIQQPQKQKSQELKEKLQKQPEPQPQPIVKEEVYYEEEEQKPKALRKTRTKKEAKSSLQVNEKGGVQIIQEDNSLQQKMRQIATKQKEAKETKEVEKEEKKQEQKAQEPQVLADLVAGAEESKKWSMMFCCKILGIGLKDTKGMKKPMLQERILHNPELLQKALKYHF